MMMVWTDAAEAELLDRHGERSLLTFPALCPRARSRGRCH
jgi:hypothetical protein